MSPTERKQLRLDILKELYDYHFANNGESKSVVQEVNSDSERKLAYEYLEDKGLIYLKLETAGLERRVYQADAKINARGIDSIESEQELSRL